MSASSRQKSTHMASTCNRATPPDRPIFNRVRGTEQIVANLQGNSFKLYMTELHCTLSSSRKKHSAVEYFTHGHAYTESRRGHGKRGKHSRRGQLQQQKVSGAVIMNKHDRLMNPNNRKCSEVTGSCGYVP